MDERFPVRSRCPVCGYRSGAKPGRSCPECGETLEVFADGYKFPTEHSPPARAKWWVVAVAIVLVALMVLGMLGPALR